MTRASGNPLQVELTSDELNARRTDWVNRVTALVAQIAEWARDAGWDVTESSEGRNERLLGAYDVPVARVQLPRGDLPERALLVYPIALHIVGGNGRVDLEGYPSLSRVKLVGTQDGGWQIMTDSNVPLRQTWNAETFRQLADDLVA